MYAPPASFQPYAQPPGFAPAWLPPPGEHTFKGIRSLRRGAGAVIAASCVFLLGDLVMAMAVWNLRRGVEFANMQLLLAAESGANAASAIVVLGGLVALVGACAGLYGAYQTAVGKQEFGPAHVRAVRTGSAMVMVALLLYLLLVLWRLTEAVGFGQLAAEPTPASFAAALERFGTGVLVEGLLLLIAVASAAVAMRSLVFELMTHTGRRASAGFLLLSLIGPLFIFLIAIAYPLMVDPISPSTGGTQSLIDGLMQLSGWMGAAVWVYFFADLMSIFALSTYMKMLREAENGARNMIQSGVYDPDAVRPPVVYAPRPDAGPGAGPLQ